MFRCQPSQNSYTTQLVGEPFPIILLYLVNFIRVCVSIHPILPKHKTLLNSVMEQNSQDSWVSFCTHRLRYLLTSINYFNVGLKNLLETSEKFSINENFSLWNCRFEKSKKIHLHFSQWFQNNLKIKSWFPEFWCMFTLSIRNTFPMLQ